jgi:hypothetical protein
LARPKRDAHFYELAKRGAEARLRELGDELKLLFSAFPDLRKNFDPEELPIGFILRKGAGRPNAGARKPGARGWSPDQRKAAAARMKAYWAKRKAARTK